MILPDIYSQIALLIEASMDKVTCSLRSNVSLARTTKHINSSVWKNKDGLIIGSVSIWISNDPAEDTIDGVVATNVLPDSVAIQVDVCKSSGSIIRELLVEHNSFKTNDQLFEIIKDRQTLIRQLLINALEEVLEQT